MLEALMMSFSRSRRRFGKGLLVPCLSILAAYWTTTTGAAMATQTARPAASVTRREVIRQALPGEPERDISLVEVIYPPETGSPPHLHANGVMAFVVSGLIASQVGNAPERTFRAGEAWWEPPGAVHRISRNASATDPATLLAIYIAPKGATPAELMKPIGDRHAQR
jgi:quercetin dioxygenase-like cupin family protein